MGEGDLCKTKKTKKLKKFTQGGQDSRLIFKAPEIKGTYKKIPYKKHWMPGMKELVDGAVQFLKSDLTPLVEQSPLLSQSSSAENVPI